ncbi:MAG: hypothetical protein ACM3TN_26940 [Alphaproteobacteria bacterium]
MRHCLTSRILGALTGLLILPLVLLTGESPAGAQNTFDMSGSRLSDQPIPLDKTLERPPPLFELGDPFLGAGNLQKGFTLPTGAVWQPSLVLFGDYRTAVQTFSDGKNTFSEWANRLDLFANLQLTGTERVLLGLRPLDRNGKYFGYQFNSDAGFKARTDGNLAMLFFEGDFGELFPKLDFYDRNALDYGFSVGRQPLLLQDGILLNDTIDSIGIVRNSLHTPWTSGWRLNFYYGWNYVYRNDNRLDTSAQLLALSTAADFYWSTMELDFVYVPASSRTGDGLYAGFGATQRIFLFNNAFNTTLRILGSRALDRQTPQTSNGVLLFSQIALTPKGTLDWAYLDLYWAIDKFSSAARGPDEGGPLARIGLLFSSPALGRYGSALDNEAEHSVGFALGYQMFFDTFRRQLLLEVGARKDTTRASRDAAAIGARLQQAIWRHLLVQFDTFVAGGRHQGTGYGGRTELTVKF